MGQQHRHSPRRLEKQAQDPGLIDEACRLHDRAVSARTQGQYAKAESCLRHALHSLERAVGSDHPNIATVLNTLAGVYEDQGQYTEAERLSQRAVGIMKKAGRSAAVTQLRVQSMRNLAALSHAQGNDAEAEWLYRRALRIKQKLLGPDHPDTAMTLNNLAVSYTSLGKYTKAAPLYRQALAIFEHALGSTHPKVATCRANYARLLRQMKCTAEASALEDRANKVHP